MDFGRKSSDNKNETFLYYQTFKMLISAVNDHKIHIALPILCFPQALPLGRISLEVWLLTTHFWKAQINLAVRTGVSVDCLKAVDFPLLRLFGSLHQPAMMI